MSAPVYDVYISPGQDSSPSAQMKLVAAIAARFRVSAPTVAEGLQVGRYLLARSVNETTATRLQQQLREMGASATAEPAAAPTQAPATRQPGAPAKAGSGIGLSPLGVQESSGAGPSLLAQRNSGVGPSPLSGKGFSLAPLSRSTEDIIPAVASSVRTATVDEVGDDLGLLGPLDDLPLNVSSGAGPRPRPQTSSAPSLSPLAPAARPAPAPRGAAPRGAGSGPSISPLAPAGPSAGAAPAQRSMSRDRAAPVPAATASLALDRQPERRAPHAAAAAPIRAVSAAGMPSPRGAAPPRPADGLQLDTDNVNVVKCVVHGLYYNKLQSSGCVRCMEVGRKAKQVMDDAAEGAHGLRFGSAARRAFFGLAVALMLGFIPASYYAQRINEEDVSRIRARQEELSKMVATDELIKEFDGLDLSVETVRSRGIKVTLGIWTLVAAVAGLGWYRVTDS